MTATQALGRSLRTRHVTMISVGGIIGAGLFVGSSAAIASIGPASVVSYGLAGLVILLVMRAIGEMAAAFPGTGSFTEFARLGLGHWAGFTAGWLYWYFWVIVVPIEAIAGASILHGWVPGVPVWGIGLGLLTAMTCVNLLSARSFGEFEFWFSSIKVAAIAAFLLVAGAYACGFTSPHETFGNLVSHGGFAPRGGLAVLAGIASVIFAFVGAEIITIAAAESDAAASLVAKLTLSVAARILLFYVLSILLIVAVVPWDAIRPGQSPFAVALAHAGLRAAPVVMNVVVLTAVLSCLNSGIYITSRVLFGLAAHGDAPAWLVSVNRRQVPARAILAGSAFGYAAIAVSVLSPTVVFTFLINASGAIALVNYLLVLLAELRLRRGLEAAGTPPAVRMWAFPYASWAAVAGICAVLVAMGAIAELRSQLLCSAVSIAVVLGAFAVRRAGLRRAGKALPSLHPSAGA